MRFRFKVWPIPDAAAVPQPRPGDWDSVMVRVRSTLRDTNAKALFPVFDQHIPVISPSALRTRRG